MSFGTKYVVIIRQHLHEKYMRANNNKLCNNSIPLVEWFNKRLKIDLDEILAFEINIDPIKYMFSKKKYFKKINSYPKILRDLNLVMPYEQKVGEIVDVIFKKGKKLIMEVDPVDIFIDEKSVGKGLKSVTYNITFQSSSKTLEDKDVNSIIDEIIHIAEKNFNAKLRV